MTERNSGRLADKIVATIGTAIFLSLCGNAFLVWRDSAVMLERMDSFERQMITFASELTAVKRDQHELEVYVYREGRGRL